MKRNHTSLYGVIIIIWGHVHIVRHIRGHCAVHCSVYGRNAQCSVESIVVHDIVSNIVDVIVDFISFLLSSAKRTVTGIEDESNFGQLQCLLG